MLALPPLIVYNYCRKIDNRFWQYIVSSKTIIENNH